MYVRMRTILNNPCYFEVFQSDPVDFLNICNMTSFFDRAAKKKGNGTNLFKRAEETDVVVVCLFCFTNYLYVHYVQKTVLNLNDDLLVQSEELPASCVARVSERDRKNWRRRRLKRGENLEAGGLIWQY